MEGKTKKYIRNDRRKLKDGEKTKKLLRNDRRKDGRWRKRKEIQKKQKKQKMKDGGKKQRNT